MRGIGGPLLCIGDLLSDVGESDGPSPSPSASTPNSSLPSLNLNVQTPDLIELFQEKYDRLNEVLAGTGHSWTALTLELCTSLQAANKLVHLTSCQVGLLSLNIGELERVVKRGDSSIAAAKAIHNSLNPREGLFSSWILSDHSRDHVSTPDKDWRAFGDSSCPERVCQLSEKGPSRNLQ